jgi:Gpi18-like mannosyltransferase
MRLALWGWMVLARAIYQGDLSPDPVYRPYMGVEPVQNIWLQVWQRWDTVQYQAIAERGYGAFSTAVWSPPLYPFLMRLAGMLLGGNTLVGGMIVSNIFCLAALWAYYLLAEHELQDSKSARRALIYVLIFPASFFLFAPYTEPIYFFGSALCFYAMTKKQWLVAGLSGALAAASRLPAVLLCVPVFWSAWQEWKISHEWRPAVAPMLTAAGGGLYPLYVWLGMGLSPLAPFQAADLRFHGGFTFPGVSIVLTFKQIWSGIYVPVNSMDLFFTLLFIFGSILVWRRLPHVYGIYCGTFMLLYLARYADTYPLLSMTRYVLALFPVFIVLPLLDEDPWIRRLIVYPSLLGLLYLSAQFAIWGWVG